MKYFSLVFILSLFININLVAQDYVSPVDFDILLSGTFGELRSNHFHAGIDIKTQGVEGQKIRAIADGYISRIKVSTWGYGKVIYINHPETGHTSVYAHLQSFNKNISKRVKQEHYNKESFELNFFPKKNELIVKQGEVIGLSGNTGGSNGAHLHFEIRETKNSKPINPLQFNFKVVDNISPILKKIKFYCFDTTLINGYNSSKIYNIIKHNNNYTISEIPNIKGDFAIGIYTYDQAEGAYNKNGIYSIKLYVDSTLYYEFKVDKLDFNTTRYINAHIDYCEKIENNIKFHRCYKLPHNNLTNYSNLINNGIINFNDTSIHDLRLEVKDIFDNTSFINFKIKASNIPFTKKDISKNETNSTFFDYRKINTFENKEVKIELDKFSLYESLNFTYNSFEKNLTTYSNFHKIHDRNTPLHKYYTLKIQANVPNSIKSKTYIARTNDKRKFWHVGGAWEDNWIETKTRDFGTFCIISDTIPPTINVINIYNGKKITDQKNIQIKIKDIQSGIKSFRGEMNGKWILFDYEHKKNLLKYTFEDNFEIGKYKFSLIVTDKVGNMSKYEADLIY